MMSSEEVFPEGQQGSSDWFDLHQLSLQHVAEILAGFDLVDQGPAPASEGAPPTPQLAYDPLASDPAQDQDGPPPAGAGTGPRRRSRSALQSMPHASSPIGEDHPTRVYQSAGLRLFADDPRERGRFDDVPGPGPSSHLVANLCVKRPAARALDLGCGGGYLSLAMASFSQVVIGTDLNERAVQIARINARWNKVSNVEFRTGDLFEPVDGMLFDLIVSNPPFVISPDHDYLYRDGGGQTGAVCDRVMSNVPSFLTEGGFATIQCQWPVRSGELWWRRPAEWVKGSDCDLWLVSYGIQPPSTYARTWLANARPGEAVPPGKLSQWLRWYDAKAIDHIAAGVLVLRKRTSAVNWARAVVAPGQPAGDCSPHLLRIFDAHDKLTTIPSADALLDIPLGFPDGCRLSIRDDASDARIGRVSCEPDPGFSITVSGPALAFVAALDGKKTPRSILSQGLDGSSVLGRESSLTSDLRRLFGAGMLAPGDQGGGPPIVERS